MAKVRILMSGLMLIGTCGSALACDPETGARRQMAFLEAGASFVDYWQVADGEMKSIALPSGEKVGVVITPAALEKYSSDWRKGRFTPELVKIEIYDLSGPVPTQEEMSWGGANSVQGFGRNSSKDKVGIFGHGGFTLNLLKPVCATPESVSALASGANS